ncbi:MAG: hypothetical protein H6748_00630 [Spirochaetaceae bacterium]|nr:hypothetical protein [Myxococcales bacterium]MCB9722532.1 hypothetical protein [Spirochaetaceae bacterium]
MTSELSLWQTALLGGIACAGLLYVLAFRLGPSSALLADGLFLIAFALAVASILTTAPFERAASALVEWTPLPGALRDLDEKVAAIESLPRELVERALARVGYSPGEPDAPTAEPNASVVSERATGRRPAPAVDNAGDATSAAVEARGPFEARVRPAVEGLVSSGLRGLGFVAGALSMLLALALRLATLALRRARRLSERITRLEASQAPGATAASIAATHADRSSPDAAT